MNQQAGRDGRVHALVVGGTGMLLGVSLYLAEQGYIVSVVARHLNRLQVLVEAAKDSSGWIVPRAVDYRDPERFRETLLEAIEEYGPLRLAVCWIHSTAPGAPHMIADVVTSNSVPCRYFHIRGSAAADPSRVDRQAEEWLARYPGLPYRQVILGFVINKGSSRWLTHEEIGDSVITAIAQDKEYSIAGTVEPWSMRP